MIERNERKKTTTTQILDRFDLSVINIFYDTYTKCVPIPLILI